MKQLLILVASLLLLPNAKTHAQEHTRIVLNQNTGLHSTSNLLGINDIEYLLQAREGDFSQKLLLSPFKLSLKERPGILKNLRINLAQDEGLTTIGIGNGFTSDFGQGRNGHVSSQVIIGANVSLFPNWGSPSRDRDGDGLVDNFYSVANKSLNLGLGRVGQQGSHFLISAVYEQKREIAVENTREVTSVGYSASFMSSIKRNQKEEKLPLQLKWGGVVEQILPVRNQAALENGNQYQLSIAPQLEVQFYSTLILRTSLPFHVIEGKRDERGFGSFFQLFLAI